ncbi:MAG: hypothetical protein U0871_28325 [Gemmataceae bacterium]
MERVGCGGSASGTGTAGRRARGGGGTGGSTGGRRGPHPAGHRRRPDATLAELKARLDLAVSLATLWRAIARLGLTLKVGPRGRAGPPG